EVASQGHQQHGVEARAQAGLLARAPDREVDDHGDTDAEPVPYLRPEMGCLRSLGARVTRPCSRRSDAQDGVDRDEGDPVDRAHRATRGCNSDAEQREQDHDEGSNHRHLPRTRDREQRRRMGRVVSGGTCLWCRRGRELLTHGWSPELLDAAPPWTPRVMVFASEAGDGPNACEACKGTSRRTITTRYACPTMASRAADTRAPF